MIRLFGSGFYTGYAPLAPGTVASFFATIVIWLLAIYIGELALYLFFAFWVFVTIKTSSWFENNYGKDPTEMVSDEWAGQVIPFLSITFTGQLLQDIGILTAGFFLFRFFDITKPLGINNLQKIKGGFGILMDDLLAGIYALVSLKLLLLGLNYI